MGESPGERPGRAQENPGVSQRREVRGGGGSGTREKAASEIDNVSRQRRALETGGEKSGHISFIFNNHPMARRSENEQTEQRPDVVTQSTESGESERMRAHTILHHTANNQKGSKSSCHTHVCVGEKESTYYSPPHSQQSLPEGHEDQMLGVESRANGARSGHLVRVRHHGTKA